MTTESKTSFGTQLWMAPHGQTLVKVAELLTVTPPRRTREFEDATSHDSPEGAEEVIPQGTYKPGEIPFQTNYIAGSAGDLAMINYSVNATFIDWKIVAKSQADTADMTGSGYLQDYGVEPLPVKGKQAASGTVIVSGPLAQAPSA